MPPECPEESKMSPEEIQALESRLENSLQKTLRSAVKEEFRDFKSFITDLINKDVEHLKEWQGTFRGYHKEHFDFKDKITDSMNLMSTRLTTEFDGKLQTLTDKLENLHDYKIEDQITDKVKDKIEEKKDRKTEISLAKSVGLFTIGGIIVGAIMYFIP